MCRLHRSAADTPAIDMQMDGVDQGIVLQTIELVHQSDVPPVLSPQDS